MKTLCALLLSGARWLSLGFCSREGNCEIGNLLSLLARALDLVCSSGRSLSHLAGGPFELCWQGQGPAEAPGEVPTYHSWLQLLFWNRSLEKLLCRKISMLYCVISQHPHLSQCPHSSHCPHGLLPGNIHSWLWPSTCRDFWWWQLVSGIPCCLFGMERQVVTKFLLYAQNNCRGIWGAKERGSLPSQALLTWLPLPPGSGGGARD